jgi:recombination protein RecR
MQLPEPIQKLVDAFSRLPGIGPKTASRLTFYLLRAPDEISMDLADALSQLKSGITYCQTCFNITEAGHTICDICADEERDHKLLCVVEDPLDVFALERTGGYNGYYHVLHGVLSPIEGIGPEDIKFQELVERLRENPVEEIIIATNPSMEGDYTASYIQQQIQPLGIRVTRLARGLPVGGDLEYADQHTLLRAITGRQDIP